VAWALAAHRSVVLGFLIERFRITNHHLSDSLVWAVILTEIRVKNNQNGVQVIGTPNLIHDGNDAILLLRLKNAVDEQVAPVRKWTPIDFDAIGL
jgi:hypothetical protein